MSRLFASKLEGLSEHYADIVASLKSIESHAISIVRADDYNELPAVCFGTEGGVGSGVFDNDIFDVFEWAYGSYFDIASSHFAYARRSDHSETMQVVLEIMLDFTMLKAGVVECELDALLRLWFFEIWKDSAKSLEAYSKNDDDEDCYDLSVFTHLAYTANHTVQKLEKYFGYLAQDNK
jgi:hypothetical protein